MMHQPGNRSGVLCIGTALVDVSKVIDAYPALDHLAFIESIALSTGGPAMNMAVDLRQLGASFPIELLFAVGNDFHGSFIQAECAKLDISTERIQHFENMVTSFTDVMVRREDGRRTFFHHLGASTAFLPPEDTLSLTQAKILHIGSPGLHAQLDNMRDGRNGWIALLAEAQDLGIYTNMELVTLPAARQRELAIPCLPFLNSVIVNELEAGALTNITYEVATADAAVNWQILEDMAQGLIELGCRSLAVIHTPAGAVAADPSGRIWRQGSVRVPKDRVRGTTGAGDAFAAGVLFGIHHDWQIDDCLRLGSASAAACIADTHTSAGIHAAEQCLKAADELGYRDPT